MEPIQAAQALDFSLLALFARASLTVKIVMIILVIASFWGWAIIIQKFLTFANARREASRFDRSFWSGEPLDDLYDRLGERPSGASERIFAAGMTEWRRSHREDGALIPGGTQRIDRAMNVAIQREETRLFRGLSFLATVGATAPFIGLFGTVWGIKNAFEGIAMSQNTSLAVVAPGIAEALLATALGLLAAIPAVIFYNKLSGDAERVVGNWESFADEFSTLLSRQLDDKS
ncbi:protein TolQ [Paracoccus alkanivorans]|uniref:Tol-Pal system protein TolQ n=1 Tax=Paracoccus alkanivorans TaxID=2116655 RepID=A0A3M0M646_9RHOB|nr:protein TolQ [Paracoccus alkanivorans]RMC32921.1 protein TolQ [Paracoccus alkanivorans]